MRAPIGWLVVIVFLERKTVVSVSKNIKSNNYKFINLYIYKMGRNS